MSKLKTTQLKQYSMTKKQTDRRLNTTKENQYFFSLATTPHTHTHTHTHPPSALRGPAAAHGARREELPGRRALDDSARDGRQHVQRPRSVLLFGFALDAGQHGGAAAALAERSRNCTVGQGAGGPGGRRRRRKGLLRPEGTIKI